VTVLATGVVRRTSEVQAGALAGGGAAEQAEVPVVDETLPKTTIMVGCHIKPRSSPFSACELMVSSFESGDLRGVWWFRTCPPEPGLSKQRNIYGPIDHGGANRVTCASAPLTSTPRHVSKVRLASGKRFKATLNLTHTVSHLHALLAADGHAGESYVLMGGFPPKQITDTSQTIEASGLAGSQVTQKKV